MHVGIWLKKVNIPQNDSYENLDNVPLIWLLYSVRGVSNKHCLLTFFHCYTLLTKVLSACSDSTQVDLK